MNDVKVLELLEKLVEGQKETNDRLGTVETKLDNHEKQIEKLVKGQEKHNSAIEKLMKGQEETNTELARISTAMKILPTKEEVETTVNTSKEELRAEISAARSEAKADMLNLGAKLTRGASVQARHETRLKNLEKHTGTTDPTQN
jgi:DNA repair ATPase RecN